MNDIIYFMSVGFFSILAGYLFSSFLVWNNRKRDIQHHKRTTDRARITLENKQAYLQSTHWRRTREGLLMKRGRQCEVCGSFQCLEIHHISYANIWQEKDEDLVILCRSCHQEIHDVYGYTNPMDFYPVFNK